MSATDYVTIGEAARRLGTTRFTLRGRIQAGDIPVYENPLDRRRRLIPLDALEKYAALRPASPNRQREVDAVPA